MAPTDACHGRVADLARESKQPRICGGPGGLANGAPLATTRASGLAIPFGMPSIRLATEADIPDINALSNWAIRETVAHFALDPEPDEAMLATWRQTREMHPWLVAEDEGRFLGFAKSSPWKSRCAYNWSVEVTVYVHPDHHRRGAGRALYERLFEILKAQGYRTLLAGIALPNDASVRLHEAMGMRRTGEFPSVGYKFGGWISVGYWALELGSAGEPPGDVATVDGAVSALAWPA